MTIYERALEFVSAGQTIGLGSGRASTAFIRALGERVKAGLRIRAVGTSRASEDLARSLGIPVVRLGEGMPIDVTVDGADEVDPQLNLIKGYGRAMVREKIVASASRTLIILVGQEKSVACLGSRGRLPIEVVPFALPLVSRRLSELGLPAVLHEVDGQAFVSDNGNYIVDCHITPMADPESLEKSLRAIPGVVGTGLFLSMAQRVLIGDEQRGFALTEERQRP